MHFLSSHYITHCCPSAAAAAAVFVRSQHTTKRELRRFCAHDACGLTRLSAIWARAALRKSNIQKRTHAHARVAS